LRPTPHRPEKEGISQPPIGTGGLTEAEARARYGTIDVYRSTFCPLKHTLSGRDETTTMKLVVDRASDRVVGRVLGGRRRVRRQHGRGLPGSRA
jgi:glutathione reductase (NADPH)